MYLTRKQKLMNLFLSDKNSLWDEIKGLSGLKAGRAPLVHELAGISPQTLSNWRNGGVINEENAKGVFENVNTAIDKTTRSGSNRVRSTGIALEQRVTRYRDAFVEEQRIDYAANILNMSISTYQQVLDTIVSPWPFFPDLYYSDSRHDQARSIADRTKYRGIYTLWVRRDGKWMRCPLHVRYLLELKGGSILRCKMHVPELPKESIRKSPTNEPMGARYYEYDGALAVREKQLFWIFEKRARSSRNDYFCFITAPLNGAKHACSGRYLTSGQDIDQSIVTDTLVLCRETRFRDLDDEKQSELARQFMKTEARLGTREERQEVEQLQRELMKGKGTGKE
jgi:hypothetical protein